jgi:hypothetical protein
MHRRFLTFGIAVKKGGRTRWRWRVSTSDGVVVMRGSETTRLTARYQAERALFMLLLSAPHHLASPPIRTSSPNLLSRSMPSSEEYRKNAEDCLRSANEADDPKEREVLLRMASQWRRLADYKADIEAKGVVKP